MLRDTLVTLVRPVVEDLGYELGSSNTRRGAASGLLRLYIDAPAGIAIDDCERVSRAVSALLDVEDPVPGQYTLEVSSPGLERPLRTPEHFASYAGEKVFVEMAQPVEHGAVSRECWPWPAPGRSRSKWTVGATRCRSAAFARRISRRMFEPRTAGGREMSKEILRVAEEVSNEKGVDKEVIFEALEAALASATRKKYGEEIDVRVAIDRKDGELRHLPPLGSRRRRRRRVESPDRQLRLDGRASTKATGRRGRRLRRRADREPGFGRIAAQAAKQVIVQRVREAERAQVVDA